MDLDLSEEQQMLRDMVRGVCASYAPLTTVRALEDDPVGCELVDVRRAGHAAAIGAQRAGRELVGHENEQVGAVGHSDPSAVVKAREPHLS